MFSWAKRAIGLLVCQLKANIAAQLLFFPRSTSVDNRAGQLLTPALVDRIVK